MDSNFKLNQLYLFRDLTIANRDLTIAKVVNEHYSYPTFKETRRGKGFAVDIHSRTFKCTELFFKIEDDDKLNLRKNYYAYQFLTDSFELAFHNFSLLVKSREPFNSSIIRNKIHINGNTNYIENKFLLIEENKKEHILISNFIREVAEPILKKHNRLFKCL